jgi:hypothetical protein
VSQNINVASSGSSIGFQINASTGKGGAWLSVANNGVGCCFPTPLSVAASVVGGPTALAPGTYTGQVVFTANAGLQSMTVPVYLIVSGGGGPVPDAPGLIAPADTATGVPLSTTLAWGAAANATSYDIYFGTTNPPPFVTNIGGTTYGVGPLAAGTTYFWNVVAKNGSGSTSSTVASFVTGNGGGPISLTPSSGATGRQSFSFLTRHLSGANSIQYTQFLFTKSGLNALTLWRTCFIFSTTT